MLYWILMIVLFFLGGICGCFLHYVFGKMRSENPNQQEKLNTYENIIRSQEKLVSMGKMTAGIAHEVKNALTFVTNFSILSIEFLDELHAAIQKDSTKENHEIEETFHLIKQNVSKIAEHAHKTKCLMNDMLTHVRQEESAKSLTDIHQIVEESIELSRYAIEAEYCPFSVKIIKNFDENLPKIPAFPSAIAQVLINLLNNAYYSVLQKSKRLGKSYDPSIVLTTKADADNIVIIVKDNGEGIPTAFIDTIFRPFSSSKPANIGAGLGLSICWDIVNKHQGTITVDAKEGEYAEFMVTLPK
ncbi:MAG: ATP-binding protein [Waddliaceae bacterium]